MPNMKIPKDLRLAAVIVRRTGWEITVGGSGHLRWKNPAGKVIVTAATPSKNRGEWNAAIAAKAQLRRAGLAI